MHLALGSSGPVVRAVQQAVGTGVDGSFGQATRAAVEDWQSRHDLPTTGVVDSATWRALLAAGGTSTTPAANPLTRYLGTVLRRGSHGLAVRALQTRLGIVVDGSFGPQTKAAVNRFKRAHHLPADGVVRRAAWRALGA